MSNIDPYRAPQGGYQYQAAPAAEMQYGRVFGFVFESPNWLMNLVWTGLCALFSSMIVGTLILNGYQAQILIASAMQPGARYPDFDSNKIGDYLVRGLWVWLGLLISSIVVAFLAVIIVVPLVLILGLIISATSNPNDPSIVVVLLVMFGYVFFIMSIMVLAFAVITPVSIKVGLSGNLGEMFDLAWHFDFLKKMVFNIALGALFLMLINLLLSFLGMLLCFVGIFPAMGWFMMSQAQFHAQLYRMYLQRGGRPVPIQMIGANF